MAATEIGGGQIKDGGISDADIAADAAIDGSKLAAGTVTGTQLAAGAAAANISADEITETMIAAAAVTGVKIAAGAVDLDTQSTGTLSGARVGLSDGAILVGDAGNAGSDLTLTAGQIIVGDAAGKAVAVTMSGDATIDETGAVTFTAAGATLVDGETPAGTIDGSNDLFTLANVPTAASEHVYLNGLRQKSGDDYTIAADEIEFTTPPPNGSNLLVDYRY